MTMISYYLSIVETDEEREKIIVIYNKYYSYMAYKAGMILKNQQDIEDTVHNAMLKIIDNLDLIDINNEIRTKSFFTAIVQNKAKDLLKLRENQNSYIEESITENRTDEADPSDVFISKETYDTIIKTIRSMSDTYRDVCMLKYVNGLKEREIALVLDLTPKNVSLRVFRGKQILREALRKEQLYV